MPVATHAGQESGGRVPLSSTSPSSPSTPSPPLGSLRLASQAPFPASASRARSCASLCLGSLAEGARARDPRRVHDAVTPTRAEPREEKAEGWLVLVPGAPRQWPATPPLPPAAASGWARPPPRSGHYHSGFWFRSSVPGLPHVPDSARLCPAPGRWPRADGGGLGGQRRGAILTYTCREDSITGEDCWTKGDPQPRE